MPVVQLRVLTSVKKPQMQMAKWLSQVWAIFRLVLRSGTPNIPSKSSEAPSEGPPDAANSICYRVPSPPASPFIPDYGPIPEGKGLMTVQPITIPSHSNDLSRLSSPEARRVQSTTFSKCENDHGQGIVKTQQAQASPKHCSQSPRGSPNSSRTTRPGSSTSSPSRFRQPSPEAHQVAKSTTFSKREDDHGQGIVQKQRAQASPNSCSQSPRGSPNSSRTTRPGSSTSSPRNPDDPPFPDLGHLRHLLVNPQPLIDLLLTLGRCLEEKGHRSTDVDSSSSPAEPQPPITPPCHSAEPEVAPSDAMKADSTTESGLEGQATTQDVQALSASESANATETTEDAVLAAASVPPPQSDDMELDPDQSTDVDTSSSPAGPQPPITPPCPSIDRQFPDLEYLQRLLKDSGLDTLQIKLGQWLGNNSHESTDATSSSTGKLLSMTPPRPTIDVQSSYLEYHRRLIIGALLELLKWLKENSHRSSPNPTSSPENPQPTTTTPCPPIDAQVPDVECLQSLTVVVLLIVVLLIITLLQLERRPGNNRSQSTHSSSSSPAKSQPPMTPLSTTIDARFSDLEDRRRPLVEALLRLGPWLENIGDRFTPGSSSSPSKPQPPLTPPCTPIDKKFPDLVKLVQCLENNSYPSIHDSSSPTTSLKPPLTPHCNPIDQQFPESEDHWLQPVDTLLNLMRYPESDKSRSGPPNTSPMSSQSGNSAKSGSTQSDASPTSPPAGSPTPPPAGSPTPPPAGSPTPPPAGSPTPPPAGSPPKDSRPGFLQRFFRSSRG
ncbi:hypothetical protein FRC04_008733 [Tulasnella sp. 424]|nr:hypothetical protein FRC04_008733 [Tulasnella sp. 424]KAG8979964.1 hypothetical protein FRC05_007407 [Tulasnella sp. 425]